MAQKDLTPQQIERELRRLKSELGKAREKLNQRAEDYLEATRDYKKEFAKTFVAAKIQGNKTVKECEMLAQQATAGLEAMYKATEQLVLNERKAVDTLLAEVDITRSLYSKAYREQDQYHHKGE
jgi:4-hydroxy-L-threonine phosphate dehydrogenase PdxA